MSDAAVPFVYGPVLAIVGPTATGKSEVALQLAERLHGEIISVDSMQVYQDLDIGTAKPSLEERARVRHHLIDVVALGSSFDAAQFVKLANLAVAEARARGCLPIFCGGTGLYLKAFFDGLGEAPPASEVLRTELEAAAPGDLLRELAERDPVTHDRIDRRNIRRVIRALEVIRLTNKPYSVQRADWGAATAQNAHRQNIFGLMRTRQDLHERIEVRVETMFQRGLVAETEVLLKAGLGTNRTAMQALGYRQVVEHLQRERSLPETIALVKARTRQFAKRQLTWFRRQLPVEWLEIPTGTSADDTAEQIRDRWRHRASSPTS